MPPPTQKTCTRPGCGRRLRSNNTTGVCGRGCLSSEAPPAKRASGGDEDALTRFRRVAKALGKDPNAILDGAMRKVAEQWLKTVEDAVR